MDRIPDLPKATFARAPAGARGGLLVSFILHATVLSVLALVQFLAPPAPAVETFDVSFLDDEPSLESDDSWIQRPSHFRTGEGGGGGGSKGKELLGAVTSMAARPNFSALSSLDALPLTVAEGPVNPGASVSDILSGMGNGEGMGIGDGVGNGVGSGEPGYFGMKAESKSIVFVVDASSSMNRPYPVLRTRFRRVQYELLNAISKMTEDQHFLVIFFSDEAFPMPARGMVPATPANQQAYMKWVAAARPLGSTEPEKAVILALRQHPDTIYFLTDGDFDLKTVRAAKKFNPTRIPIHTIGFGDNSGENRMKQIASESGGTYRFISEESAVSQVEKEGPKRVASPRPE